MKKKVKLSGQQQSADYVVGQVSGSLFQQNSAASGSLSALFSTTGQAAPLQFKPAPKPLQKKTEREEQKEEVDRELELGQTKKKKSIRISSADQKLQNREESLQEADEDEEGKERLAKKRKRKTTEMGRVNDAEHWVMKRQRLKANKHQEVLKSKRTVFVGNLPISCSEKDLRSFFKDGGAIESVRFRSVVREDPSMSRKVAVIKRKVHPQKQSLNAYVVFKDEQSVVKALERNGVEIEKDFHIRVDTVIDSSSHDHKRSVFVGNLSFEINELGFRKHFEKCGAVEAVRLVRDKNSGLGKGFGYVLFESADSVQLALKLDGSKLEGRSIRVKRSVKKEKNKSSGQEKRPVPEGFRSSRKFGGNQKSFKSHGSFKGEMADPNKKTSKKKGLKKRVKAKKAVHL